EHLKERAREDTGVGAGTEHVAGVVENRPVKAKRRDRGGNRDEEEHTRKECCLSGRVHLGLLLNAAVSLTPGSREDLSECCQVAVRLALSGFGCLPLVFGRGVPDSRPAGGGGG